MLPEPYFQTENGVLYHGDCLFILPHLGPVDLILTDPPYGCKNNCDYTRFSGGLSESRNYGKQIFGDEKPFDPSPFLGFSGVILFGYQFFADKLPPGTILIWNKKRESQLGSFLSDCELAWKKGGSGCYLFPLVWHGFDREVERGKTLHPTQKPVALFLWCLELSKTTGTVCDPYFGSGTTGVACERLGRKWIGIEIEEKYCEIAAKRIQAENRQLKIPGV